MNYRNVKISQDARIAKQSVIVGDVTIGRDSCVLYYAVIREEEKLNGTVNTTIFCFIVNPTIGHLITWMFSMNTR